MGLLLPAVLWSFGSEVPGPNCESRLLTGAFFQGSSGAQQLPQAAGLEGLLTACQYSAGHAVHTWCSLARSQPNGE